MNPRPTPRRWAAWLFAWLLAAACLVGPTVAAAQASVRGAWTRIDDLPIVPIHLVVLPDGKVMLWGKDFAQALWDPVTQVTSPLPNPGYDLFCAGHAYLGDGRVLVAGGHIADFVGLPDASIYDPRTNAWTRVPDMNAGRWYPTVTTLPNGDALVVSGQIDTTVGVNPLPQVFEQATGRWRDLSSAELSQGLYPMMFIAPNGQVLDAAPTHITRFLDTRGTGAWSSAMRRSTTWRDYGSAVQYGDGRILVMGGKEPPTNSAEVIDLNAPSPTWRAVASMSQPRRYHTGTILPDGQVLVTGGTTGSGPALSAEMWNPATERFTTMASQAVPRLYHSAALLLPDGRVMSTGGDGYSEVEVFSPPYLFKGARPAISAAPASIRWGRKFTVDTPDAASIRKVTLIRLGAPTHGFDQNQRINTLPFSIGPGVLDVDAPADANLAPPGPYMLFVVNGKGVPSVAAMVMLGSSDSTSAPPAPPAEPSVSTLSPSAATAGGPAFTLTVSGANFVPGSVVRWNGEARSTNFDSATQLRAAIGAAEIAAAGTAQLTVLNPDGAVSGPAAFTVAAASGSGSGSGSCSHPAWVQGRAYAAGDIVTYNGSLYIARFANPGYNPTISTYYWAPYTCDGATPAPAPAPVLSSLSPGTATAGGPAFDLTVNGSNFASGATVRWNGSARPTTFVGTTQLHAAIEAADIASAGTIQVSVLNRGGAGSASAAFTVAAASGGGTGSCSYPAWIQGRSYAAGDIVTYNGSLYIARFANPGYNPTISTYYWAPHSCDGGGGTSPPPAPPACSYAGWVQGRSYAAGAIVSYQGSLYIARFANPGYNPTISTYYWAPYTCAN